MGTHRFGTFDFTSHEIDQIVRIIQECGAGRLLPIDRRHYSKQVLRYAEHWGLLAKHDDGRLYAQYRFSPVHDVPIEALWRVIEPMLQGQQTIGFSITKHPAWETLNIWPQGKRHASNESLDEQRDVLNMLCQHGYILFQYAGSVWEVTRWHAAA